MNQTSQSLPPFALLAVSKTLMTDTELRSEKITVLEGTQKRIIIIAFDSAEKHKLKYLGRTKRKSIAFVPNQRNRARSW